MYRVWYSTKAFADYIVDYTDLSKREVTKVQMYESDASKPTFFHTMPDHIKKILYLDAPDLIVEYNSEPIFSIEISKEAGTGHNVFQRFARLGAAVENDVPAFFIYPDASIISRKKGPAKWDKLNGLIFKGLEQAMDIYNIPALFFYFSTDFKAYPDATKSPNIAKKGLLFDTFKYGDCPLHTAPDIQKLFECLNKVIEVVEKYGVIAGRPRLLREKCILDRRKFMAAEAVRMGVTGNESPVSATKLVPTEYLLNYLSKYNTKSYKIGELLRSREETLIYCVDAGFRGDPYPGSLAGLDYLMCRKGKTFEERSLLSTKSCGRLL